MRHSMNPAIGAAQALGWVLVWTVAWAGPARAQEGDWPITVAEQSHFRATSRSDQVLEFIDRLVDRVPHVRRVDFGQTVEGRSLVAAVVAQPPVISPLNRADDRRLVVLLLGNIHAGECDGKEAQLMLMRELAQQPDHPWFKDLVLVFVPNFNADGNDRLSKDNRPGQAGPEDGMGRRANAQNLDLNRDFTKLETPECQYLVALINQWDPHLLIDMHTTNGSRHRYALTYDVPHNPAAPARLRELMRQAIMPEVTRRLEAQHIATYYYGNFNRDYTQWVTYGDEPRYGIEYFGLRGRLSILAESYAYISYEQRIVAQREFARECLNATASRASTVSTLLDDERQRAIAAAREPASGRGVPIRSEMVAQDEQVVIQGFLRTTDANGRRITTQEPHDYTVDFLTVFRPTVTVPCPHAYLLPASAAAQSERLRRHGIELQRLARDVALDIEYYRIESLERAEGMYQGHHAQRATVQLHTDHRTVPQGTTVVRLAQPLSTLIVQLLEPHAVDGFLAWDLFEPPLTPDSEYPVWRVPVHVELPLE